MRRKAGAISAATSLVDEQQLMDQITFWTTAEPGHPTSIRVSLSTVSGALVTSASRTNHALSGSGTSSAPRRSVFRSGSSVNVSKRNRVFINPGDRPTMIRHSAGFDREFVLYRLRHLTAASAPIITRTVHRFWRLRRLYLVSSWMTSRRSSRQTRIRPRRVHRSCHL